MTIKIVTDSTVDLSKEEAEKYGIHVVPLQIHINEETYLDRVNITPSEFMEKMKASEQLPKTSQPAIGTFAELYNELTNDGSEVLSIHLTKGLSGTVNAANLAASQCNGKVTVIDSNFISKALAFQVIEAAQMAKEGKSLKEIITRIEEISLNTKLYVVVDTLENLVKGGRIGKGKAMIGSLLNIKPIAALQDGVLHPVKNVRSHSQVVKLLVKIFEENVSDAKVKGIGLTHANARELANKLKDKLQELYAQLDIRIEETTPVISTHTGPGAIGFMFYTE